MFNIKEINLKEYKYPGFEPGDILQDIITGTQCNCLDVKSAEALGLNDEEIPKGYMFILVDRINKDYDIKSNSWTNPELYTCVSKRKPWEHKLGDLPNGLGLDIEPPRFRNIDQRIAQNLVDLENLRRMGRDLRDIDAEQLAQQAAGIRVADAGGVNFDVNGEVNDMNWLNDVEI